MITGRMLAKINTTEWSKLTRLDFSVQGTLETQRQVHAEALSILNDLGVNKDLVWLAEIEVQFKLVHELAVLL